MGDLYEELGNDEMTEELGADGKGPYLWLGSPAVSLAATLGITGEFVITSDVTMEIDRIVIPDVPAASVNLKDAKVQGLPLFGSSVSIPGDLFKSSGSFRMRTPVTIGPNKNLTITVENNTAVAVANLKLAIGGRATRKSK